MIRFFLFFFIIIQFSYTLELTPKEKQNLSNISLNIYVTNWEPFTIHNQNSVSGISAEIWEKMILNTNLNYTYIKDENFTKALNFIKNDKNGMIIATSSTKAREEYGSFTKPIVSFPISIATNIKENFIVSLKELEGKTVAVGENYTAFMLLKKHFPKIKLIPVKDTLEALDLLAKEKVYAAADILPVLIFNMNKYNFTNLKISGTSEFNFDVKFMLNKHNEELIPTLNKLIDSVDEITKQNILNKWIYTKQITQFNYTYLYWLIALSLLIISFILFRQRILNQNKQLIEQEKNRYENLMNLSSDMVFILDFDGNLLEYSKQVQKHLGYSDEEMKSLTVFDWDKNIDKKTYDNICKQLTSEPFHFQTKHTKKNNTVYDADITAVKININNKPLIYSSARDITNQNKLLKELEASKKRFENMFKTHDSVMLLINPDSGKIIDANNSAIKFYGFSLDEFKNMNISDINPLSYEIIHERTEKAKKLETNTFRFNHQLKDGSIKIVEVNSSPIEMDNEIILFSIIKDITKEIELEKTIIKEKNFISTIINNANAIIAAIDHKGYMFMINEYAQNFLGYTQKEISAEPYFWSKFLEEKKREKVIDIINKAQKGEIVKSFKNSWISKNGEEKVFEWSNTLVRKDDGSMNYLVTIGIDVTDRENIQKRILEQKLEFETIFKTSKDGMAITDLQTNFLELNHAYEEISGYSKEELLNTSSLELASYEHKNKMQKMIKIAIETGHVANYEKESVVSGNKRVIVNMSITLLPDKKRFLIIIKDITMLKQMEKQTKLMAMGEMIGNIAHQWRQPLSVITTAISGLKIRDELSLLEKNEIKDTSDIIINQATYLSNTIENFKNFIKEDKSVIHINLEESIKKAINIVEASLQNNYIKLNLEINDDLIILGNSNELAEALINIITNSKDMLKLRDIKEEDRLILINTNKLDEHTIELKILDSAGGVDENIINRILEPYFTTKHKSQGTGLGLSIVDKIIRERHNGSINIYNEVFHYNNKQYKGLCFKIIFNS
jgi:PAS domain S-box-containing protein